MKYLDIRGKTVIDNQHNVLGRVDNLIVDLKNMKIRSLVICNTIFLNSYYIISFKDIKFSNEFIELDKKMYKIKKSILIKNKEIILQNHMDKEILDVMGRKLGKLIDIVIDLINGKFIALIASGGFFEDLFEGRKIIPVSNNTVIKQKKIIVDECSFSFKNDAYFKKYLKEWFNETRIG